MGRMIFGIVWTGFAAFLVFGAMEGASQVERSLALVLPLFGLFVIWSGWTAYRRRKSLRIESEGGTTFYVWIETDGRECRSTRDPRPDWDAADGDGDGGDGGGD